MLKSMLVCLAVICAGAVVYAAETAAPAAAPASAEPTASVTPSASTEGALMGPAPMGPSPEAVVPSTVDGMTGEDILKKLAETYAAAKSYYEESHLSAVVDDAGQHREQNLRVTVALRRPDALRIDIAGQQNIAICFSGGDVTVLNRDKNRYIKKAGQEMSSVTRSVQFPITVIAISENPSEKMKEIITSINCAKAADLDGKAVYEVDCTGQGGMMLSYFIDKSTFGILCVKGEMEVSGPQGSGKVAIMQTADKVLVNETPKDAEGKEMDVYSLTLPEGASEVVQPGPRPVPAAPAASTGSDVQAPAAPAVSTGSSLEGAPAAK